MPDKTKEPKELIELAAKQGTYAAKNVAAAASEELAELIPSKSEGLAIAFAIRASNKTLLAATIGAGAVASVAGVKRLMEYKKARDARKANEKAVKVVDVTEQAPHRKIN